MKQGDEITLDHNEIYIAVIIGARRNLRAKHNGKNDRNSGYGKDEANLWFAHLLGAMAELAFAKGANTYWPMLVDQTHDEPDVFPNWQIRCGKEEHYGLIIRRDDEEKFNYVLMTGTGPKFRFRGWIDGKSGRLIEYWKDLGNNGAAAWVIPQGLLNKEL